MKHRNILAFICFFMVLIPLHAVGTDRPTVFVSIAPQKFFVQQICGEVIHVETLVPPGADPHTYEPKPSQMRALAGAAAYFAIGVEFEQVWLERLAEINPRMRIVHTDEGIEKLAMAEHHHDTRESSRHGHDAGDDQDHDVPEHQGEGLDPHIWLAPKLVGRLAHTIAASLGDLFPEHAPAFSTNLASFLGTINELDRQLNHLFADKQGMEFIVFHPSWGYFAHAYGLIQVPVEISGKEPKPAQLRSLIERAREHEIRVIFAQPQLSTKSADVIAREIDGTVIMLDPLAENWLENMKAIADQVRNALR